MIKFFCNGKKDFCDEHKECPIGCQFADGTGGYYEEEEARPMTKADRIRSMTDDELAHEFALAASWDRKEYRKAKRIGLEKVILDILQQPAEDGA